MHLPAVPQELSRAIFNIAKNACWAAHERSRAAGPGFTPTVTVRTRVLEDLVEIRIRDNGAGVPAAIRERIFEPFFTTRATGEGTGLGLSIAYDVIVQQHRGTLHVESDEGTYAEFVITLPRSGEEDVHG